MMALIPHIAIVFPFTECIHIRCLIAPSNSLRWIKSELFIFSIVLSLSRLATCLSLLPKQVSRLLFPPKYLLSPSRTAICTSHCPLRTHAPASFCLLYENLEEMPAGQGEPWFPSTACVRLPTLSGLARLACTWVYYTVSSHCHGMSSG